jgi:hypothetical protein
MAASCSAGDGDHRLSNTLPIIDGALNLAIPSFLPSFLPSLCPPHLLDACIPRGILCNFI